MPGSRLHASSMSPPSANCMSTYWWLGGDPLRTGRAPLRGARLLAAVSSFGDSARVPLSSPHVVGGGALLETHCGIRRHAR